jgi:hypothetical protein
MIERNNNKLEKLHNDLSSQRIQLELLFSTGAIITLLALPEQISKEAEHWYLTTGYASTLFIKLLVFLTSSGINTLVLGFGLNIFFRALSLCYTSLNYLFEEGLMPESWNVSSNYKEYVLKNFEQKQWITNAENYAGICFSLSILIAIRFVGLFLFSWLTILLFRISGHDVFALSDAAEATNRIECIMLTGIVILFRLPELIVFKWLRKFTWLSKIYFPVYLVLNLITLGFIGNKQNILMTRHLGIFNASALTVIFVVIGLFTTPDKLLNLKSSLDERSFFPLTYNGTYYINGKNYDDQLLNEEGVISRATINSQYIDKSYMSIFVAYFKLYDSDLSKIYVPSDTINRDSEESLRDAETDRRLAAFAKFATLSIDDSLKLPEQRWMYTKHPVTKQLGFMTFLDVEKLKNGVHRLRVNLKFDPSDKNYVSDHNYNFFDTRIQFVKVGAN